MAEAHQRGIALFIQGRYQEAAGCFEESLRQAETSEVWNDWATAQFASGRVAEARQGLRRALKLDPGNAQAAANLRLVCAGADSRQRHSQESSRWSMEKKPFMEEFVEDIQAIPGEDPSLQPSVAEAIRKTRLDSGYFVQKCLERMARLPQEIFPQALAVLERAADFDYRLSIVLSCYCMQAGDYETALRHSRLACDRNPNDLFAENTLIACSRRQATKTGTSSEFEGLEAYLAESFCEMPWDHLEISCEGDAFLCCPGWLPLRVGDVRNQSLEVVWNSSISMGIRQSILDGSFRFCSKIHCQHIAARTLPRRADETPTAGSAPTFASGRLRDFSAHAPNGPRRLHLGYDKSCNLACPQCRTSFYVAKRDEQERMDRDYLPFILRAAKDAQTLYLDGAGEVFASRHSRHVLSLLTREQFPGLKFWLISNGQLLNERAFREFDLSGRVHWIQISLDAARAETYRLVRRGADFPRVLSNLAFLDELRRVRGESFRLELRFVVSSLNFRDIPDFVQLGRKYHVDVVFFNVIRNWGHLSLAEFEKLNVANPLHPEHQEFLRILESPELSDPVVDCGSVAPYRRRCRRVVP